MLVAWRYRERPGSLVQTFDPRAWFIFFGSFLFSVLMFWDLRYLAVFFATAVFFVVTAKIAWHEIRKALIFMGWLILVYTFLTFLTGRGGSEVFSQEHVLWSWTAPFSILGWTPTLQVTVERICFAISQFFRMGAIALMTVIIPYSINPALYGITFRGLGLSDKFAYAMDLTMRFVPSFGRDFQLTLDAQRARGYELENFRGGLVQQVRKMVPLLVPVIIHAIIGSEDIIDAMDLRAFGVGPRTWLEELHYRRRDRVLIAAAIVLLVGSIGLAMFGYGVFGVPVGYQ